MSVSLVRGNTLTVNGIVSTVARANAKRAVLGFKNESTTDTVRLSGQSPQLSTGNGFLLRPGDTLVIDQVYMVNGVPVYAASGAVYAITPGTPPLSLSVLEVEIQ